MLIEPGRVRDLALPAGAGAVRVLASGVGDPAAAEASATVRGDSALPPGVAHLRWEAAGAVAATVRWVRRSRVGWRWNDGADVGLGEEAERYRVTVTRPDGIVTVEDTGEATAVVPRPAVVAVRQHGTNGMSREAILAIPA